MKKVKKHPKDMTTDEAISHLFHPDALKILKKHVEELSEEKKKPIKKEH
ncbi:MAG: hypothetical protein ACHQVS_05430 [Candidatus Babeliales bacterium]